MRKCGHERKRPVQLLASQITNTNTFTNVGDKRNTHLAIPVFDGIVAGLPSQLRLEMRGMGREGQRLHALENTLDSLYRNVATEVTQDTAKESIHINSFPVHNVRTRNHFQKFREGVSCR